VIEVHPDMEALALAAANRIAGEAMEAIAESGRFAIALSGGSTPKRTYELLATSPLRERIPWQSVHVFWGDERCVPPDDERSNERMARRALLDHVPLDERNVHPIRCEGDAERAGAAYEHELQREFGTARTPLDLVLLGMGDDGHTAGLFPGSPALDETLRWTAVIQKAGEEHKRITTTLPLLNLARRAIFLVSGASKAAMLRVVIEEQGGPSRLPASRIAPLHGEALWLCDRAAARQLRIQK
jgi:6-phosphogluconolactonase